MIKADHTHTHTSYSNFDIPMFGKLYDFYKLLYLSIKLFPRKDRYSLGQKIDTLSLTIFELVITAGISGQDKKAPILEKSIVSLNLLKILLRLSKDIEALDNKRYLQLEESLQEIGRMLGGWKKSIVL